MKKEDIIRMAQECGIPEYENNESQAENIIRFAALVASAEREACAKVCETVNWYDSKAWASDIAAAIRAKGQA